MSAEVDMAVGGIAWGIPSPFWWGSLWSILASFTAAGAAVIIQLFAVFYRFAAGLRCAAGKLVRQGERDLGDYHENAAIRLRRRVLPVAPQYDGSRLTTRSSRRRIFTPRFVVVS